MLLNKLVEIFKTFDKDELKKFGRFIRSDYFNTNERITALFKEINKFYPLFENEKLTKEYLFKAIYGKRNFEDKTFRYLLAELMGLAEKFIALTYIENDKVTENKNLINGLIIRNLFTQAKALLKNTEDKLDTRPLISGDYLENKIDYYQLWHHILFLTNKQEPLQYKHFEQGNYQTLYNLIELFHLFADLKTYRTNFNIAAGDNVVYGFAKNFNYKGMLDDISKMENDNKSASELINAFKIYLCFMITLTDEKDEEYFYKMREMVKKYGSHFDREEHRNLYVMLLNCCRAKSLSIDYDRYMKNYLEIAKSALTQNLLMAYEGQYMDVSGFEKIFQTALYLKEYAWAEYFAGWYVNLLAPEYREDLLSYSEAELCFRNGKFEESLKILGRVKYNFFRLKINVRTLTLMNYYELGYIEEAFSLIDSFAHFLTGNTKFSEETIKQSFDFISFTKELLKFKSGSLNKRKFAGLKNKISASGPSVNKNWLIEKSIELESNLKLK